MENSKFLKLNSYDFLKGMLVSVLSAIITYLYQMSQNGFESVEWNIILQVGASSLLAYLLKNLGTNSKLEFGRGE